MFLSTTISGIRLTLSHCLDLLLPLSCLLCGETTGIQAGLCSSCQHYLPPIERYCRTCGIPLVESAGSQDICGACLQQDPPFHQCRSLFHYQPPVDQMISRFKYHADFAVGRCLGRLLGQAMCRHYSDQTLPETLVPIPLHRNRLRQRGYNQALELARGASSYCGIPVSTRDISRTRDTPPQTRLSAAERQKNVRNVFSVSAANRFKGVTHVVIIDDVMTTMSTASSLAKLLRSQGVETIDIWTLARVSQESIIGGEHRVLNQQITLKKSADSKYNSVI